MTEKLRQSLSAAVDDEADAFELRRVLDELGRDSELQSLWDRYHLIGSALRGESIRIPETLRERVWEALDTASGEAVAVPPEPAVEASTTTAATPRSSSYLGRYTALGVAASVAFAVVLGFNGFFTDGGGQAPPLAASGGGAAEVASGPAPGVTAAEAAGPRPDATSEVSPSDVQRAQAYMLHHTQQQALNQAGVMSFVKLATYEAP